jgi:hypothetical protein
VAVVGGEIIGVGAARCLSNSSGQFVEIFESAGAAQWVGLSIA